MKRSYALLLTIALIGAGSGTSAMSATSAPSAQGCVPEVGFSPEGSAQTLVERAIDGATKWIRLGGYSFTSVEIVKHLIAAKQRGVDVAIVVDEKENVREDRSGKARAALNLLVNAGIPVRTISVYPIHHDKYMVIDGETVQTGSFNYSRAAAVSNSENALVLHQCQDIARAYAQHWKSRWDQGRDWKSTY